jgi:hypothetical protein
MVRLLPPIHDGSRKEIRERWTDLHDIICDLIKVCQGVSLFMEIRKSLTTTFRETLHLFARLERRSLSVGLNKRFEQKL